MNNAQIEAFSQELTNDYYYKRIQKELREKRLKAEALKKADEPSEAKDQETINTHTKNNKRITKKLIDEHYFKDQVLLTSKELDESQKETTNLDEKQQQTLLEKMKYNAHEIMRNYNYKIDFKAKKDDFLEMYKYNLQETRSHNSFTARFAMFKAGIVGQILSAIGIPSDELKKLKKTAFNEAFEENIEQMQDHVYHAELAEILHGKTKKTKRTVKIFEKLQTQLVHQMNNIGRVGFWSKSKLLEEKISQCQRIRQEFINEKNHLEYLLNFVAQQEKH